MASFFFKLNDLVDVKAENNSWLVGRVQEITSTELRVAFDGWGQSLHSFPINSKKVAFLRTHTSSYTGNPKTRRSAPIDREKLDFQYNLLTNYFKVPFLTIPPHEFILFFRGELPIFVEELIEAENIESDDLIELIIKNLERVLDLVVKYFEEFSEVLEDFQGLMLSPDKFESSAGFAVASSLNDFCEIVKKVLGLDPRCSILFVKGFDQVTTLDLSENIEEDSEYSNCLLHLLDYFLINQGFESMIKVLGHCKNEVKAPLQVLSGICLQEFENFVKPDLYFRLNLAFKVAVMSRLEALSEIDLKYLDVNIIQNIFAGFGNDVQLNELLLTIYIKLLKSPFLEKRIRGINGLSNHIKSFSDNFLMKNQVFTFLASESVIINILDTQPHEEVLKRSARIFGLMGQFGYIERVHCEFLVGFIFDGTEKEKKAGLKIIKIVAQYLNQESLLFTFNSLTQCSFNESNLAYLYEFCLKSGKKDIIETCELFFKGLIQENKSLKLTKTCVKCLKLLYQNPAGEDLAEKFINSLPEMLLSLNSAPPISKIAISILSNLPQNEILTLASQLNLKKLMIQNLLAYSKASSTLPPNSSPHNEHILAILQLLQFIFTQTSYKIFLKTSEIAKLWEVLVKNSEHSEVFLTFLSSGLIKDQKKIFKDFFLNPEKFILKNLSVQEFLAFKHFFFLTNNGKSLIVDKDALVCVKNSEIIGIDQLITVYLSSQDDCFKCIVQLLFTLFRVYEINSEGLGIFGVNIERFLNHVDFEDPVCVKRTLGFFDCLLDLKEKKGRISQFAICKDGNYKEASLPVKGKVRLMRKKISKIVQRPLNEVAFRVGETFYSHSDDFCELELENDTIISIEKCEFEVFELDTRNELSQNLKVREIIFKKILKNPDFQQQAWDFAKNLLAFDHLKQDLLNLKEDLELPSDPHEFLHLLKSLKPLSQNQDWFSLFLKTKLPEKIFDFFISSFKICDFFVPKCEIFLEILPVFPIPEKNAEILYFHFLNAFLKTFRNIDLLENKKKFIENCQITVNKFELGIKNSFKKVINSYLPIFFQDLVPCLLDEKYSKSTIKALKEVLIGICKESDCLPSIFLILSQPDAISSAARSAKCRLYWKFLKKIGKNRKIPQSSISSLYFELENQIFSLSETEESGPCLKPMLKIMKNALKSIKPTPTCNIIHFFQSFLAGSQDRTSPSKCIFIKSRTSAYNFILTYCRLTPNYQFEGFLKQFFQSLSWRTLKNWKVPLIHPQPHQPYSGIKNLGNTCYISSLFQQLYFISEFRDTIFSSSAPDASNILFQVKKMFTKLHFLSTPSISPKSFCSHFQDYENHPINPFLQMDIDEFFCQLLEKLDTSFQSINSSTVQDLFGFHTSIEMKSACSHKSSKTEFMLSLPIDIKSGTDLVGSLNSIVEGERMQGENSYFCDICEEKMPAQRKTFFQSLPNYLVFVLRRFEFDYKEMLRKKLEDRFEFGADLDLKQYCSEQLSRGAANEYFQFELQGVVVHIGKADKGHYISLVKGEEGWIEFNDSLASQLGSSGFEKAFGGGRKKNQPCAYLLIYKRKQIFEFNQLIKKKWEPGQASVDWDYIKRKNYEYWVKNLSFREDFLKFQLQAVNSEKVFSIYNSIDYFLTVLIRIAKMSEQKFRIFQFILERLDEKVAEYLVEIFCSEKGTVEFILTCPDLISRKFVVILIKHAIDLLTLDQVYKYFEHFLHYFKDLAEFSIVVQYFEIILIFCNKVPEKIEAFGLFDEIFRFLLIQPLSLSFPRLESSCLGYSQTYKHKKVYSKGNSLESSLSSGFDLIQQFLIFCPEVHFKYLQSPESILYLSSKALTSDSQISFAKLYQTLSTYPNSTLSPANFITQVLSNIQKNSSNLKKSKLFIVSQFLTNHPNKVQILEEIFEFVFSFIYSLDPQELEHFLKFILEIVKDNHENLALWKIVLGKVEAIKEIVNRVSGEVSENLKGILRQLESGRVESKVDKKLGEVGQNVWVYEEFVKRWVEGRVLQVIDEELLLIEFYWNTKRRFTIKWVKDEDVSIA